MQENKYKVKLFFKYLLLVIEYLITAAYIIVIPIMLIIAIELLEPPCWNSNSCSEEISTNFIIGSARLILYYTTIFALLVQSIWLTHRSIVEKPLDFTFLILTFLQFILICYL